MHRYGVKRRDIASLAELASCIIYCKIDGFAKQLCGLVSRTMMYYIHSPLKRNVMSNNP